MRNKQARITGILAVLMMGVICTALATEAEPPVKISFDDKSDRTDLITKEVLPDYTSAERGSVQFHHYKLDNPDRFVSFTHDGVRNAGIDELSSIEKVQERFAVWRLRYRSGRKNTPRIQHLAVSFIPLDTETGEPGERVYLLLKDLDFIGWEE